MLTLILSGHVSDKGAASCTSCPAGYHRNNNQCVKCPENTFSAGGVDTCTPCPSDQVIWETWCQRQEYRTILNCTISPPDVDVWLYKIQNLVQIKLKSDQLNVTLQISAPGSDKCIDCGKGSYINPVGNCEMCSPGYFSDTIGLYRNSIQHHSY